MDLGSEISDLIQVSAKVPAYWHEPHLWAWSDEGENAFYSWPGGVMTKAENGYTLHAPKWVDHVIVNACNGYYKTEDITVEAGKDIYLNIRDKDNYILSYEKMEDFPDGYSSPASEHEEFNPPEAAPPAPAEKKRPNLRLPAVCAGAALALGLGIYLIVRHKKRH